MEEDTWEGERGDNQEVHLEHTENSQGDDNKEIELEETEKTVKVEEFQGEDTSVEIQHYTSLPSIPTIWYSKNNIPLQRAKIDIQNSSIYLRHGALHIMEGELTLEADFKLTNAKSIVKGTGRVYLEATFQNYFILPVHGVAYVDRGLWAAADGNLKVSRDLIKGGLGVIGGEGLFQDKFEGEGWVCLRCEYPPEEIHKIPLQDSKLCVDGAFSVARLGDVEYWVGFAGEGGLQKLTNTTGEGKLNQFQGSGEVWLCVTEGAYPILMPQ